MELLFAIWACLQMVFNSPEFLKVVEAFESEIITPLIALLGTSPSTAIIYFFAGANSLFLLTKLADIVRPGSSRLVYVTLGFFTRLLFAPFLAVLAFGRFLYRWKNVFALLTIALSIIARPFAQAAADTIFQDIRGIHQDIQHSDVYKFVVHGTFDVFPTPTLPFNTSYEVPFPNKCESELFSQRFWCTTRHFLEPVDAFDPMISTLERATDIYLKLAEALQAAALEADILHELPNTTDVATPELRGASTCKNDGFIALWLQDHSHPFPPANLAAARIVVKFAPTSDATVPTPIRVARTVTKTTSARTGIPTPMPLPPPLAQGESDETFSTFDGVTLFTMVIMILAIVVIMVKTVLRMLRTILSKLTSKNIRSQPIIEIPPQREPSEAPSSPPDAGHPEDKTNHQAADPSPADPSGALENSKATSETGLGASSFEESPPLACAEQLLKTADEASPTEEHTITAESSSDETIEAPSLLPGSSSDLLKKYESVSESSLETPSEEGESGHLASVEDQREAADEAPSMKELAHPAISSSFETSEEPSPSPDEIPLLMTLPVRSSPRPLTAHQEWSQHLWSESFPRSRASSPLQQQNTESQATSSSFPVVSPEVMETPEPEPAPEPAPEPEELALPAEHTLSKTSEEGDEDDEILFLVTLPVQNSPRPSAYSTPRRWRQTLPPALARNPYQQLWG